MKKTYCDICGDEIDKLQLSIKYHHHIQGYEMYQCQNFQKMKDGTQEPFSTKIKEIDSCLKCYNRVMGKMFTEIKSIQNEHAN